MKKLDPVLLDLEGLVYNAYHAAMSPEPIRGTIKKEINTATYGFNTFLTKFFDPALDLFKSPIHFIACIDDGNMVRLAIDRNYKANREKKKQEQDPLEIAELDRCMDITKRFLAALGIPLVRAKGEEADDLIAYFVQKLKGRKTILTIDKDLSVLSSKDCGVFMNGQIITEFVDQGTHVPMHLVSLYLSMIGDSSDGFPGVVKFGRKSWTALLESYGVDGMEQLEHLIKHNKRAEFKAIAATVRGDKRLAMLAEQWDHWQIQYQLAMLHPEACEEVTRGLEWYKRLPTRERLLACLDPYGMGDIVQKYDKFVYHQYLVTEPVLDAALAKVSAHTSHNRTPFAGWDYETYDPVKNPNYIAAANGKGYVDMLNSKIAGCSFALGPNLNEVYYFPVAHAQTLNVPQSKILEVIQALERYDIEMVAQNIIFESTITKVQLNHDLKYWHDTRAFAHHLDENRPTGLKLLSKRYLNYDQTSYQQTLAMAGASDMSEISGEAVLAYGCDDSFVTGHLAQLFSWMTQCESTYDFIVNYECEAIDEMGNAYINGICLDPAEIARQAAEDADTMDKTMATIRGVLDERCKTPNFAGVEILLEEESPFLRCKVQHKHRKLPQYEQEAVDAETKRVIESFRAKAKQGCVYQPLYSRRKYAEYTPTPAKLTSVAQYYGLPPIEKVTLKYISDYVSDNREAYHDKPEALAFLTNLAAASSQFKEKSGDKYFELKQLYVDIMEATAPTVTEGTELNFGSPKQMQHLLYLLLGLPIRVRTKVQKKSVRHKYGLKGSPATDKAAIDFALANDCGEGFEWRKELLQALQKYHKASTRTGMYWKPWPLWMDENNLVHPGLVSPSTVTRRPTCSSPNLLQVSKGPVRNCVVPRHPDNVIVSVDFSSQELMVLADLTQDHNFLSAYTGAVSKDLHAITACGIVFSFLRTYPEVVIPEEAWQDSFLRRGMHVMDYDWFKLHQDDETPLGALLRKVRGVAKTVNFGAAYGAVGATVSQQTLIPLDLADSAVDGMVKTYPGLPIWKEKVWAFARRHGYVATTYGSRRHCGTDYLRGNGQERGRWERQLSNFEIQGQCADLLKVVLADARREKLFQKTGAMLLAPIYDELLSEVPKANLYEYLHGLADLMEIIMPGMTLRMKADCSFGATWGNQIEVGIRPTREKIAEALAKLSAESEKSNEENPDDFDVSIFDDGSDEPDDESSLEYAEGGDDIED